MFLLVLLSCGLVLPKSPVSHIGSCIIHVPSTHLEILDKNPLKWLLPNYRNKPFSNDIRDIRIFIIISLQPPIPTFILSLRFSLYPFLWLETNFNITCAGISIENYLSAQGFLSDRKSVLRFSVLWRKNSAAVRFVFTITLWFAPIQQSSYTVICPTSFTACEDIAPLWFLLDKLLKEPPKIFTHCEGWTKVDGMDLLETLCVKCSCSILAYCPPGCGVVWSNSIGKPIQ